jgi:flagellar biosynthetic protein FliR
MTASTETFSVYVTNFLFILLRMGIFVAMIPVIGSSQFPGQFRIGLAVFISILLTPVVKFDIVENHIPMIVMREIFLGLALGFVVRFVFLAVNMAGSFISHTIGMSVATAFNPEMGQSTQISEVYGIMAMLFFLVMDAHHDLIFMLVKSFELLPAGAIHIKPMIPKVLSMGTSLFAVGLKIAAPIMVGTLITYLLSGFLYKAAPQMNIFFIVLPLNIFLGFLLIILSLPVFEHVLNIEFSDMKNDMLRILSLAKG